MPSEVFDVAVLPHITRTGGRWVGAAVHITMIKVSHKQGHTRMLQNLIG